MPYLVWTLIYLLLQKRQDFHSLKKIILDIVLGQGIGIGYFIIVLAQMILLTPFIARLQSIRIHFAVILLGTLAGLSLTYAIRFGEFSRRLATFRTSLFRLLFGTHFITRGFWLLAGEPRL